MSQLFVDNIKNRTGGALGLPSGVVVTGVGTFSGAVSIGGTLTYEDVTNIDAVGIITARSDVSISDKIIHTGDTNTAIRFPAADTFTVETAGSERVRVTSAGDVGIGTDIPSSYDSGGRTLVIDEGGTLAGMTIRSSTQGGIYFADGLTGNEAYRGRIEYSHTNDSLNFGTAGTGSKLSITSGGGFHFDNGELIERANVTAGKLSDNTNIDLENGMVHLFTTAESTTSTPNIRVSSSTSLNSVMATGDTIAVTIITTAAAAGYSAQLTIDGGAVTENWVGGSAPSSGGSSGVDIYNYTIIKTADATFTVVANYTATS